MSRSLASRFPDEFLVRAVSVVAVERPGGWAELFLERSETIRGEWDSLSGHRVLPGTREGFALRRVSPSRQEHLAVEGLHPEQILSACRSPAESPPADILPGIEEEDSAAGGAEGERLVASVLQSLSGQLAGRIAEPSRFSLALEWRRRLTAVISSGHLPRREESSRVVLTCRTESCNGEIALGAGAASLELLLRRMTPEFLAGEILRRREEGREAREAPEGEQVVILAPGTGGVFFHEACGHALEADLVLRQASVFRDLLGESVAPDFVGAMDDSTQPGLEGSYGADDEGISSRGTMLIARGRLKSFLTDRISGGRLGRGTTGNGRRESFRDLPLPRMSNTFLLAGDEDPEEILRGTSRGVYVRHLEGGRVDTATGEFLFRADSGSLIEEGRLDAPLLPFSIAGNGLAALRAIERVGRDLDFGTGAGSCGKEGQKLPVAVGQPTLRLRGLAVRPG